MATDRSNQPDWDALARDTILAIAFQQATRGVHSVGRDGRSRMGCVDLLCYYAVDEMLAAWVHALDVPRPEILAPSEEQAMALMAERKGWRDWLSLVEAGEHAAYGLARENEDDQLGLPL